MSGRAVERRAFRISGTVQGVGLRPSVHALATELGLAGVVGNDGHGVFVEVEGDVGQVDSFARLLVERAPPLARIDDVAMRAMPATGRTGFTIATSTVGAGRDTLVSPDVAPCEDCLAELADPSDRRFRYPFVNCTNCGPRFSIVTDVPYDRRRTTMAGFEMCPACAAEYHDPTNRRFHAQPTCCPECGPRLCLFGPSGRQLGDDPLGRTVGLLREGAVVALKGVGGYQLLVDASDEEAVTRLRASKHREEKPFALLVCDLEAARQLCLVGRAEASLLTDPSRPIVLLRRRAATSIAPSVAPGNAFLGVMLPASPLHLLLCEAFDGALVCTSGNRSDEPIAHDDADALDRLGDIADAFCTHDRPIHIRVDDSVTRVVAGRPLAVRRARGLAPRPVLLSQEVARPLLAVGAQLKNTVCLAKGRHAFVSQHLGDLANAETHAAFAQAIDHYERLFDVEPELVAHDLHPQYLSTTFASQLADATGIETVGVQHHHAHIASCLADNDATGPVIGVAFDGLGFGTDGTLWGGELLVADLSEAERVGHLEPVPMPGGEAAVRQPWRMAAAHLVRMPQVDPGEVRVRHREAWPVVTAMAERGVNAPVTSSMGRLFDAVAALAGVRDEITYEGQAAIELEQRADPHETGAYAFGVRDAEALVMSGADVVAAAAEDLSGGVAVPVVAARFHNAVVRMLVEVCVTVRGRTGLGVVALSGGVFQNARLVEGAVLALDRRGFEVLTHRQVPPNDGGISLGQAAVAGARDRRAS